MKEDKRFSRIIPRSLEKYLINLGTRNANLDYGRDIIIEMVGSYIYSHDYGTYTILDIGAGCGTDLINIRGAFINTNLILHGTENYPPNVETLQSIGINVINGDI